MVNNRYILAPAALLIALGLSACSSGDAGANAAGSQPSAVPSSALPSDLASVQAQLDAMPDCAEIWQEGKTVPPDYEGCMKANTIMAASFFDCNDGSKLYQQDADFWAVEGQEIHEESGGAASSSTYAAAYAACNG